MPSKNPKRQYNVTVDVDYDALTIQKAQAVMQAVHDAVIAVMEENEVQFDLVDPRDRVASVQDSNPIDEMGRVRDRGHQG